MGERLSTAGVQGNSACPSLGGAAIQATPMGSGDHTCVRSSIGLLRERFQPARHGFEASSAGGALTELPGGSQSLSRSAQTNDGAVLSILASDLSSGNATASQRRCCHAPNDGPAQ